MGKDYVQSKKGLSSVNEAILNLMFCEFMSSSEYSEVVKMPAVGDLICNNYESWEKCRNELSCFKIAFDKFVERRCTESKIFVYWHSFVAEVFSNSTQSYSIVTKRCLERLCGINKMLLALIFCIQ